MLKRFSVDLIVRFAGMFRTLLVAISVTLAAPSVQARAQTSTHDLILAGVELCVILLQEPHRATAFSAQHGITALRLAEGGVGGSRSLGEAQFGIGADAIPWLVSSSVRDGSIHVFSCEFSLAFDEEIASTDVSALAQRLGLNHTRDSQGELLVRESSTGGIRASLTSGETAPCPAAGELDIPAETQGSYLSYCGRTFVGFSMVSVNMSGDALSLE